MIKFSANVTFMFLEYGNLVSRYEMAKKSGFANVECANPYEITLEKLDYIYDIGLHHALINSPSGLSGENGMAALPNNEERFQTSLDQAIKYAKKLSCPIIHILAAVNPIKDNKHVYSYDEMEKTYLKNLKFAIKRLGEFDLIGVIEPICPQALPNYFLNSFLQAIKYIKEIDEPNLKLQLDFYHLQRLVGNVTENVTNFMPFIGHIQISQVPSRNEPDSPGELNYDYIFSLLQELNYTGFIGLEYKPKGNTIEGLKWMKNIMR